MSGNWRDVQETICQLGVRCLEDAPIAPFTTLGIGGRAQLLAVFEKEEHLLRSLALCRRASLPFVLIGGGSNVAFADGELAIVLAVNQIGGIEELPENRLRVGSGVKTGAMLAWCQAHDFGGCEFLSGIPGSIGGAAVVNAGAFGSCLANILISAHILETDGTIGEADISRFAYSYRGSALKFSQQVVLSLVLQGRPDSAEKIAAKIAACQRHRRDAHPSYKLHSAGCFFKNPVAADGRKMSAGKMLEECGLKGKDFGPLRLSERHANFMINAGGASFADLLAAEAAIINAVEKGKGIRLEREVVYVDALGRKW